MHKACANPSRQWPPNLSRGRALFLVESGVCHTSVWCTCGAVALNGALVTAAEAVKAAGERAAELRVEQQQRTELVQLREAELEVERARFAAGRSYRDINGDARAVLIKCIFKLKGEKGFSKI